MVVYDVNVKYHLNNVHIELDKSFVMRLPCQKISISLVGILYGPKVKICGEHLFRRVDRLALYDIAK